MVGHKVEGNLQVEYNDLFFCVNLDTVQVDLKYEPENLDSQLTYLKAYIVFWRGTTTSCLRTMLLECYRTIISSSTPCVASPKVTLPAFIGLELKLHSLLNPD